MKTETKYRLAIVVIIGALVLGADRAFAEDNYCKDTGLAKEEQALFCMYMVSAQMSFVVSGSMVCEDGPGYPVCVAKKMAMFKQGQILLVKAAAIADEKRHQGLFKKLIRKLW